MHREKFFQIVERAAQHAAVARQCLRAGIRAAAVLTALSAALPATASDHLDSPLVIADPRLDIGDLYAWTSPDAERLNLVMTIVGPGFSDRAAYTFHIDSGPRFGATTATVAITCRFNGAEQADCRLGDSDRATGNPGEGSGIASRKGDFRLFAGRRDDPFFNNVRGTRDAYSAATAAFAQSADTTAAPCPHVTKAQAADILERWRRTDGGPATNFLRGWSPMAIILSVKTRAVARGGPILAVWAATASSGEQVDRAARPLTGNALLATFGTADEAASMKIDWNRSKPADGERFAEEIAKNAALYDAFDGQCGNGFLFDREAPHAARYRKLARLLADDRLWVNSRSGTCGQLFAVERAALADEGDLQNDCGGRTITDNSLRTYRSLLVNGTAFGVSDGLEGDEKAHSLTEFPFLAAPDPAASPS